jgi:HTH-type transcriptional regulator / antitoxin HigA
MPNMIASMQPLSERVMVRPIKTEADYAAVLAELDTLIGQVEPGTPDGNRYELLTSLVEAYEAAHYPIAPSDDPIAMIEFVLEARGLTRKDLEPFIGTRQRVWDIMEKRRRLTLPMIRYLAKGLKIPIEVLVQEYELRPYFTSRPSAISTATPALSSAR